ncbi:hypothetical protein [Phreatobacter oligotrophus]|uniref:Uncharacterized protein n=1 Tax=Phreatobacter oligotrophus TaxID=1122261 RepID=A0A2T4ZIV2_9HYPH|nr:hypothetical protein [Phreatobacter oligotrophus]PTM61901.1 hypothetical protein C8P69_101573 [Phreatobacter oligotrophus]
MKTTRYARFCLIGAAISLVVAVGLAALVIAPGVYEHYPQMLRDVLPILPAPFHIMLGALAVATVTAATAFVLSSLAARSTRFRRFLDVWWDRRHFHRRSLA